MTGSRLAHQVETKLKTEDTSRLVTDRRLRATNSNGNPGTGEEL